MATITPQAPAAPAAQQAPQASAPSTGSSAGALFSKIAHNYALPLGQALVDKVTGNPGTALLATFTVGLLYDRYNQVNNKKLPDVEMDNFAAGETSEAKRQKIKLSHAQLPERLHRTDELDTIGWKLRIRNVIVVAQLAAGIAAFALLGSSWAFAQQFGPGALIGMGVWLVLNSALTAKLGRHLKLDKYTFHVEKTERNMFLNLKKAKYRSNFNNTVRFVIGSIPIFTPFIAVSIQVNKWKKEGQKLARLYHY